MGHMCIVQQLGCVRSHNWGGSRNLVHQLGVNVHCLNTSTGPSIGGKCAPCVYGPTTGVVPQLGCVCMIQELWSYNWGSRLD